MIAGGTAVSLLRSERSYCKRVLNDFCEESYIRVYYNTVNICVCLDKYEHRGINTVVCIKWKYCAYRIVLVELAKFVNL